MNKLLGKLENWGCDIAGAMERVVDDEELYVTCLGIFLTDENFEALGGAVASGDATAAFEYAHALKGVAANLGLTPVYTPVSELVETLRKKGDGDLQAMYEKVMAAKATLAELTEKQDQQLLFVCYPKCTTCQKARAFLDAAGQEYLVRDIKQENPTLEELRCWHKQSGLPLKQFFNTSGLAYKAMKLKAKLPTMTEEQQLALLATDGMLVRRPILVTEETVLVGFREEEWKRILAK